MMREGDEFRTLSGGTKKFLYSGPVNSKARHQEEQDQWSFGSKAASHNASPRTGLPIDLESVWSIRNVGLGPANPSVKSEPVTYKPDVLNKNSNPAFYSRHGGMKGRTGSPNNNNGTNSNNGGTGWSSSGHNLGHGSRLQPPTFQGPSERSFRNPRHRNKNPSPFDFDANDF